MALNTFYKGVMGVEVSMAIGGEELGKGMDE